MPRLNGKQSFGALLENVTQQRLNEVASGSLAELAKQLWYTDRDLVPVLQQKTMKAEVLRKAVEIARSQKWLAHSPMLPRAPGEGTISEAGQRKSRCVAFATDSSNQPSA